MIVGQSVDDRDAAAARQFFDVTVRVGPHNQAVHEPRQDPGGVGNRLAPAKVKVVLVQEERVATQLMNADLERDTGARAGLGEDQRPSLAREHRLVPKALPFELPGHRKDLGRLLRREVRLLQKVLHGRKKVRFYGNRPCAARTNYGPAAPLRLQSSFAKPMENRSQAPVRRPGWAADYRAPCSVRIVNPCFVITTVTFPSMPLTKAGIFCSAK